MTQVDDLLSIDERLLTVTFKELLDEYVKEDTKQTPVVAIKESSSTAINSAEERKKIERFLSKKCKCGRNCQDFFTAEEVIKARADFRSLSKDERNSHILTLLHSFTKHSEYAKSARSESARQRQKFEYRINIDRPVCKEVFLFYYGETTKRLERLQKHLAESSIRTIKHGNTNRAPHNAFLTSDRDAVKTFIINFAANQGLPDPGRDVRKGQSLRILLPSVMNYRSTHKVYKDSVISQGREAVEYQTFIRIWHEELPYIVFCTPRTDLCYTCEDFKKQLNQTAATLDEDREQAQANLYQAALEHLRYAQKERLYYRAQAKVAHINYNKLIESGESLISSSANSREIVMHYSWDFSQQFYYPYEDQQVGPIYFKTPRRAQLFGICCEGIPRQVNYLIDEADFTEKNANTVISLLDHFFNHHGLGEQSVYLTADNCVGQNKNNAIIQYLMYRVLTGLHNKIELSFLVVGHTKFSPDGYFGLIRRRYRRSKVYTYNQLAKLIEDSSSNGHNICQRYRDYNHSTPNIVYRDWSSWLSRYFSAIPLITNYQHFKIGKEKRGEVILKTDVDAEEEQVFIMKKDFPYSELKRPKRLPKRLMPQGLSPERQKYLYDKISVHIPNASDRNDTCPKPYVIS